MAISLAQIVQPARLRHIAQFSQLGIEIGTFDVARAVGFHHKAYLFD